MRPRYGIDLHGLLHQTVEQFSSLAGLAAVELKREFVDVIVKVFLASDF